MANAHFHSELVQANGASICVSETGEGTPVVLLHGLIASSHVFQPLAERARGVRLIAVDLPRSGKSSAYAKTDPGEIADAIAAVLAKRGVKQFVLVGHSFGGVVALELAARFPSRVKALLLASVPAVGLPSLKRLVSFTLTERIWLWLGPYTATTIVLRQYLRFVFGDPALVTAERVLAYQEAMAAEGSHAASFDAVRALASYRLPVDALAKFKGPRAVIWGDRDRLVPVFHGEQLAQALGVEMQVLHLAGHFLPEERPDEIWQALQTVLPKARTPRTKAAGVSFRSQGRRS